MPVAETISTGSRQPATADAAALGAGLDALDTPTTSRRPLLRRVLATAVPPLLALALFIGLWQAVWASAIYPEYQLPAPLAVWREFVGTVADGSIWSSSGSRCTGR